MSKTFDPVLQQEAHGHTMTAPEMKIPAREPVYCPKCNCAEWTWFSTTSMALDTMLGTSASTNLLSREFRCARCGKKATVDVAAAIVQTEAYRQARMLVIRDPRLQVAGFSGEETGGEKDG